MHNIIYFCCWIYLTFFFYIFLGSIKLCYTFGCFKSSDTQVCVTMDGDEVVYANFKNGSLIWDSKIPTAFHEACTYSQALYSQHQCRYFVHDDWKQHETIMNTKGNWFPINIYTTSCYNISHFSNTYELEIKNILPTAPPEIIIYPRDEIMKEEDNSLICLIKKFFPPSIKIKWTKNDIEVKVEDPFIKCLPNPDGTFYVFSHLDFVPEDGDIYSCSVEHEALTEPLTKLWGEDKVLYYAESCNVEMTKF